PASATRADRAVENRLLKRPDDDLASIAIANGVGVDQGARLDVGSRGISFRTIALVVAADEDGSATRVTGSINRGAFEDGDAFAENLDAATRQASVLARSLQGAAVLHHAGRAAVEDDFSVSLDERVGADHARVVDHCIEKRVGAARRKEDVATVGFDASRVDCGSVERCLIHAHPDQSVTDHVETYAITRGERHGTGARDDHAVVAY